MASFRARRTKARASSSTSRRSRRSVPALELDEVVLGIAHVGELDVAGGRRLAGDLAGLAAVRDDLGDRRRDVFDGERDVTVARAVRDRMRLRDDLVVRVDLDRRPVVAAARQSEMRAADARAGDPGAALEPRAREIALGWDA